jgi:methionyl-tRNA formyltransferase
VLLSNEKETGVTIMALDKELDHGPILTQKVVPISPWPPKGSALTNTLAHEGGKLLAEELLAQEHTPKEQNHTEATFTHKIKKTDGEIDPVGNPEIAYKKIRAFDEWPSAYFFATKKTGEKIRVVVKDASFTDGTLTILRVVPEGKKEMAYQDFLRGL